MHLCTISVDRYLSLRYPMKFGRNKTRRRVTLKIIFVWLLSIAMSLPLSLMYSQDHSSVLVKGTCQIPDPVYKLVGSIVCFYIPLGVMLLTYYLTVRLLAQQRQNLGGSNHHPSGWASGWLGQTPAMERRCTWRRLLKAGHPSTPNHAHSATSTDTELSTLDTHELWLPDSRQVSSIIPEPTPSTMTALHQFGAEMLKLSRGLESVGLPELTSAQKQDTGNSHRYHQETSQFTQKQKLDFGPILPRSNERTSSPTSPSSILEHIRSSHHRRSRSTWTVSTYENQPMISSSSSLRKRYSSLPNGFVALHQDCSKGEELCREYGTCKSRSRKDSNCSRDGENVCYGPRQSLTMTKNEYLELPPPCTCPYFGDRPFKATPKPTEVKIISSTHFQGDPVDNKGFTTTAIATTVSNLVTGKKPSTDSSIFLPLPATPVRKLSYSKTVSVVTWDSCRNKRRGSSFGGVRTSLLLTPTKVPTQGSPLRRSATLRNHNNVNLLNCDNSKSIKTTPSSPCLMQRNTTVRSHHSRNSSVISRNSSRHGRIIRLEQKATKVLGVVFFTFVILWAPFFVLNLLPTVCGRCEENISHWVFDVVTWLGYASSMVNPIFYTIFNKVFRQAFKKVLMCRYGGKPNWRPNR
ncbi:unnamed protein product [Hermetia illucens]|uniref:G-protein coupled receptors family 1 profile domain-containing protein n=1 Tax=Hermetia illucens TaxID=343691 RepID=A0A7R8Z4C2_HERIL|nr:unnamed protein product [Hermetia illucens]